jgi:hypothetical protein
LQTQLLSNGGTFVNVGNLAPFTVGSGTVLFEGSNPFYVQDELESQGTVIVDTASIGELIQNTLTDGIYAAVGDTSVLDLGGTGGGLKPGITKIQGPPDQTAQYGFQGWTELQMNTLLDVGAGRHHQHRWRPCAEHGNEFGHWRRL